jgi:hypothetical protein
MSPILNSLLLDAIDSSDSPQRTILNHFRQISRGDQQGEARVAQLASMTTDMVRSTITPEWVDLW